ncbi:MAG TPA: DUF167 domain-containing protein [Gemmatimonadales bacterium]|nr:DUF167 domain-containing protein [Gemmatimonadales bacterium]
MSVIAEVDGGVRIPVRVQPRASRSEAAGIHGDRVRIRLAAPPVDGAANEELVRFLARALDVPARNVEITAGHSSRSKTVRVAGITAAEAATRLRTG